MPDDLFEGVRPETRPTLVYQGVTIHEREEMLSLTDMWKADGSRSQRTPAKWRSLPASQNLVAKLVALNVGKSDIDIFATYRGGLTPGTWAHWQIAMAYAQYLSPDFHLWCNRVVKAHMTGRSAAVPDRPASSMVLSDLIERIGALERAVLARPPIDPGKDVVAPILRKLRDRMEGQELYLKERFQNSARRDYQTTAMIEALVDDTTRMRMQMQEMVAAVRQRTGSLSNDGEDAISIGEVMARKRIGQRSRSLSIAMSLNLIAWCDMNSLRVQRRQVSADVTRCFFDPKSVDQWWEAVGEKEFGRYVKKGVRA